MPKGVEQLQNNFEINMVNVYVLTLALTFSNDAGFTKEKQIRNTSWKKN